MYKEDLLARDIEREWFIDVSESVVLNDVRKERRRERVAEERTGAEGRSGRGKGKGEEKQYNKEEREE